MQRSYDVAAVVKNLDREFLLVQVGRFGQRIVNDSATGGAWREALSSAISSIRRSQAIGRGRIVEMCSGSRMPGRILAQGSNIIDYPERSPLRGKHQVVAPHHQVRDWDDRQVGLECLPVAAAV